MVQQPQPPRLPKQSPSTPGGPSQAKNPASQLEPVPPPPLNYSQPLFGFHNPKTKLQKAIPWSTWL